MLKVKTYPGAARPARRGWLDPWVGLAVLACCLAGLFAVLDPNGPFAAKGPVPSWSNAEGVVLPPFAQGDDKIRLHPDGHLMGIDPGAVQLNASTWSSSSATAYRN